MPPCPIFSRTPGSGSPAAVEAGLISLAVLAPDAQGPQQTLALLCAGIDALLQPCSRRFAVVDCSHAGTDPRRSLALQVVLAEEAAARGVALLSFYDRSMVPPEIVHDAVSSHRLVLAHGVLGENLNSVPASGLMTDSETSLDVDRLLRSLNDRRGQTTDNALPTDAASRRLSEANELLQREIAERVRMEHVLSASEERYRLLVEALPDCVFVHSAGAIVFVNPAGVEMVRARAPRPCSASR